ncbi:hypothetical protein [Kingella negevensis]|uniref:hypothetical protein n=1 Tax=Kingella negevensis TaxID=1522312 RepID=UPI000A2715C5|nr:hypothetical protein [Kingella negevensis]WII91284.1 UDP-glucose 6-dehydrogenase [Kingella negevensis]
MKHALLCSTALMILPMVTAEACWTDPPTVAFIKLNDKNHDGMLDLEEWKAAQVKSKDNLIFSFEMNTVESFNRRDVNYNGKINAAELGADAVRYKKDPCVEFQASLSNMSGANSFMRH